MSLYQQLLKWNPKEKNSCRGQTKKNVYKSKLSDTQQISFCLALLALQVQLSLIHAYGKRSVY